MKLYDKIINQRQAVDKSYERLIKNKEREWGLYGHDTGHHELNMAIGGFIPTRLTTIGARSGTGKAQPLHSIIYTPTGPKTMGEILPGDLVLGADGVPIKVLATFPQGIRKVYKLKFSDGAEVEADENHLWKVYTARDRASICNSKHYKSTTVDPDKHSLLTTKELLENGIQVLQSGTNRKNYKLPVCKPLQFIKNKLIIPPYTIGALIGDGCLMRGSITTTDEEILSRVCDELDIEKLSLRNTSNITYSLGGCGIMSKLRRIFGTTEIRSLEKFIPKAYLYSSIEDRINLLRGLMDTDGHVSSDGTSMFYYTISLALANDVKELVGTLGGIGKITNLGKKFFVHKNIKKQSVNDAFSVTINLPNEINPFYLKRKLVRATSKSKYLTPRYIESIDYIGEMETKCILVDSADHLYITDGVVITHNTTCTAQMFDAGTRVVNGRRCEYLFATWELDPSLLIDRHICSKVGCTLRMLNQGAKLLDRRISERIDAAYREAASLPVFYQTFSTDIETIKAFTFEFVRRCKEKEKIEGVEILPVVVIDYINMAMFDGAGLRTYGIAEFMNGLKQLCNELGVATVVFAQLNRGVDKENRIPDRVDFSDSSAIENASDNLIVLYRPEHHGIKTVLDPRTQIEEDSQGKLLMRVLKGRDYGTGDVLMNCDIKHFRFWADNHEWNTPYYDLYNQKDFWIKQFGLGTMEAELN